VWYLIRLTVANAIAGTAMSASILGLSPELLEITLSHCDYASSLALSLTCRAAYQKMTTRREQRYSMTDLLQIELWPCYDGAGRAEDCLKQPLVNRDYFACYLCLRIRATTKFSNAMMKAKRGKHCLSRNDKQCGRSTRFCIDCGISSGRYLPGTTFDFGGGRFGGLDMLGGGRGVVCRSCKRFERTSPLSVGATSTCSSCLTSQRHSQIVS